MRKANIVIFNAQESESDNSEERISHDKNYVQEMLKQMGIDVTVKAVLRLGARGAGDHPMKIKLKNAEDKIIFFKNARKLKTGKRFEKVYVNKDMTPLEQGQRKLLVQEMKEKQAKSNKDQEDVKCVIRQGKVIKGRSVKKDGGEPEGEERV